MSSLKLIAVLSCALLVTIVAPANAEVCGTAVVEIDDRVELESDRICEVAAQFEHGELLVYVSAESFDSESAWWDHLDGIQAELGFRDAGAFALDALALSINVEGLAAVDVSESFEGTPLWADENVDALKATLRSGARAYDDDPSELEARIIEAIARADELAVVPPPPPAEPDSPVPMIIMVTALLGLGAMPLAASRVAAKNRRIEQLERIQTLDNNLSPLLVALEELFGGSTPSDALIFQVIQMYGGDKHGEFADEVEAMVSECQAVTAEALATRAKLSASNTEDEVTRRGLIQQWESLYGLIVGSRGEIVEMSAAELKGLLDPMASPEDEPAGELAEKIRDLRRGIDGQPLAIDLNAAGATTDADGLLGRLADLKGYVQDLREAQELAPQALADAEATAEDAIARWPEEFPIPRAELESLVEPRFQQAKAALDAQQFVYAIDCADAIGELADALLDTGEGVGLWLEDRATWEAASGEGLRPPASESAIQTALDEVDELRSVLATGSAPEIRKASAELVAAGELAAQSYRLWRRRRDELSRRLSETRQRAAELSTTTR